MAQNLRPRVAHQVREGLVGVDEQAIGQAGENLSLISGIVNDRGRLAARSGLGAVMGSKKLKAVVLQGSSRVVAHDPLRMKLLSWK
ncbi:MAG: hypothetical protein HGA45_39405, partial [Chloroflexales bacterium]|nr:hypothetical protein [Chloroflexales bacterium]